MTPDQAKAFLQLLGGKVSTVSNKQIGCHCVYAPWKHEGGTDNNPSGLLYISDDKPVSYRCFSCERGGTPDQIYHEIKYLNEITPRVQLKKKKILDVLNGLAVVEDKFDFPDYETEINKSSVVELHKFSESWWESFPSGVNHPYMKLRGIDMHTANRLDVKLDFMGGRVLFPVRDWDGILYGAHGRTICDSKLRYFAYPQDGKKEGPRNPSIWMGEHHVDLSKPVILTEGQFDYAKVFPFYDNVLCGLTTQASRNKLRRLLSAVELITIFDNGMGGDKGRKRFTKYFPKIPVQHITVPEEYDDLGDCPDDVVYDILENIS